MKKIIVVPAGKETYLVTVTGPIHAQAGFGSVPVSYSAKDLPGALVRLRVDVASASSAASEVDKKGSWMQDVTE